MPSRASAVKIALLYTAVGAIWILSSSWLLHLVIRESHLQMVLETFKGWFYVAATALLLGVALDRYFAEIRRSALRLQTSEAQLRLLSDNLPVGYVYQYCHDAEGRARFAYISAGVERLHGISPADVVRDANCLHRQIDLAQYPALVVAEQESARYLRDFELELHMEVPGRGRRLIRVHSRPRRTEDGVVHWDGFALDVTEQREAEEQRRLKNDLMQALAATNTVLDGLRLSVEAALKTAHLDCGAFYLLNRNSSALELCFHTGFSPEFICSAAHVEASSPLYQLVATGKPVYARFGELKLSWLEVARHEGLQAVAVIPIFHQGHLLGSLTVASRTQNEVSAAGRIALETIVTETVQAIARLLTEEELNASERRFSTVFQVSPEAISISRLNDNRFFEVNEAFIRLSSYMREEIVGRTAEDLQLWEPSSYTEMFQSLREQKRIKGFELRMRAKSGESRDVLASLELTEFGGESCVMGIFTDITERKRSERFQALSAEVLRILNAPQALADATSHILDAIKRVTGIEAVGIRLLKDKDYPYAVSEGFSTSFLQAENSLAVRTPEGEFCRDEQGNVCLECTCGLVLSGKTDASNPLFTTGGSAWTNDARSLLHLSSDQDPRLHPRNRCIHEGFQSVALVPIREGGSIIGLLQLNDRRKGCFSAETIRYLEGLASSLGVALLRLKEEQMVRESQRALRSLFDAIPESLLLMKLDGGILAANAAFADRFGKRVEECTGNSLFRLLPEPLANVRRTWIAEVIRTRKPVVNEERWGEDWLRHQYCPVFGVDGQVERIVVLAENVTEAKLAEEALRESEHLLREMGRMAKVGGWEFNAATGEGYWTEEVARIHDLPLDIHPNKELGISFYQGESRDRIAASVEQAITQGIPYDLELEILSAKGKRKWIRTIGQPVMEGGRVVKLRGALQDITERKHAEEVLAAEATQRRILVEGSRDGIVVLDQQGQVYEANRRFAEMLGYSTEEVRHLHVWDWDCDWSREQVLASIREIGTAGTHFETHHRRKDGSVVDVELSNSAAELGGQKLVFCVCRDITERKQAEAALKEREEIFSTIVSQAVDAITLIDGSTSRFVEFNTAAHEGLGYTREEFAQLAVEDIQADHSPDTIRSNGELVHQQGELSFETRHRHRDGSLREARVSLKRLEIRGRKYLSAVWTDITERKKAERRAERDALRTAFLLELHQGAPQMTDRELYEHILERAVNLTESAIGFFHQVSEDQGSIILTTWNQEALKNCTAAYDTHYPVNEAGNWVDCIRQQKPVIYNDYAHSPNQCGLPAGHTPVHRFMSIPVIQDGKARIIFGVGNKPTDYDETDVAQLQVVANELHKIMMQRAAQKQLRQLSRAVEQSPASVIITDTMGTIEYVNPKFTEVSGYSLEEVRGKNPRLLKSGNMASEHYHHLWQTILTGQAWHGEFQNRKKNGEIHWEAASISPITDPSGKIAHFVAVKEDITARKTIEEENKRQTSIINSLLDCIPDVVFFKDINGVYLGCNPAFAAFVGRERSQIIGSNDNDLFEQKTADSFRHCDPQIFSQTKPVHDEVWITYPEGRKALVEMLKTPFRTANGELLGMLGIGRDITDRQRAERALLEREQQLRLFVEYSPAAIAMLDIEMRYIVVSQRWCSDYRLGQRNIIGASHYEVFPEIPERWKEVHRRCLAGAVERSEADAFPRADGTIDWVRWEVRPWRTAQGQIGGLIIFSEVITQQKLLEAQLRQAQKLEAVGQLAGGVAHDFNNILAAIMMQVALLQMNPTLDKDTHGALNDLEEEARRAANLTRQLLMFSRRAVLDVKPLDLDEVVENLLKMLRRLISENVELSFGTRTTLPKIEADAGMIEQVIMNLVVNARDAMIKGGKITICTNVAEFSEAQAPQNSIRRAGQYVCLTVSDTGCGMDAETLKRIFEPFFTTKDVGKGTGLGLATVHGIVAQHKGWVEVDSALGSGTTFRVYLPALAETRNLTEPVHQKVTPRGGKETILVVEDQPKVRHLLARTLRNHGYNVYEAGNGQEAMAVWQKMDGHIDLLLSDMIMPEGMTGLELTERLRALKPELKAIISSGYSAEIAQKNAIDKAGIVYIPKPYEGPVVAETVRKCLDEKKLSL